MYWWNKYFECPVLQQKQNPINNPLFIWPLGNKILVKGSLFMKLACGLERSELNNCYCFQLLPSVKWTWWQATACAACSVWAWQHQPKPATVCWVLRSDIVVWCHQPSYCFHRAATTCGNQNFLWVYGQCLFYLIIITGSFNVSSCVTVLAHMYDEQIKLNTDNH